MPASTIGFECRLGEPAPTADLLLGILPGSTAEQAYRRRGLGARPDSSEAARARHLERIRGPAFRDIVEVTATILEYDAANETSPDPAIFQGFRTPASGASGIRDPELAGRLASAMAAAAGRAEDAREAEAVRKTVATLPPRGRLTWIGAMPGREPRMVRLLLAGFETRSLTADLRRLGWPGRPEAVVALLEVLGPFCEGIALQIEVSADGVLPRLGLEVYMPGDDAAAGGASHWASRPDSAPWRKLLARLRSANFCLEPKAVALLAFPGRELVFDESVFEVLVGISHVKLAMGEGAAVGAKAYVGMLLRPAGA